MTRTLLFQLLREPCICPREIRGSHLDWVLVDSADKGFDQSECNKPADIDGQQINLVVFVELGQGDPIGERAVERKDPGKGLPAGFFLGHILDAFDLQRIVGVKAVDFGGDRVDI